MGRTASTEGAFDDFHVKGTSNVMVADAQVLDPIVSGHTQYGAIMMGVAAYMTVTHDLTPRFMQPLSNSTLGGSVTQM